MTQKQTDHPHLMAWQESEACKILRHTVRTARRSLLIKVIAGTSNDRMAYCVQRAVETARTNLIIFGYYALTNEQSSRRADRIIFQFKRLERIAAAARKEPRIDFMEDGNDK